VRLSEANPLALGSASPRRRDLLELGGVPFVVRPSPADETPMRGEVPTDYLERVARAKLEAARAGSLSPCAGWLVADTIVVAPEGGILGKPSDPEEARALIERLAGRTHQVMTRFLLAEPDQGAQPAHAQTVVTRVTLRPITASEARRYAATGEGRDKAGGYAAQGKASAFIERIDGSYTNVVGLPLSEVLVALRGLGWLDDS
jgi:septum formation protein